MRTELQELAQLENYALFQIKSIRGNLIHVQRLPMNLSASIQEIKTHLDFMEAAIKGAQVVRKDKRERERKI